MGILIYTIGFIIGSILSLFLGIMISFFVLAISSKND